MYHEPVLLNECLEALALNPTGIYVDATFGGGGHSRAILEKLSVGKLVGFDQDADALRNQPNDERFVFVIQNFIYLKRFLRYYDMLPVHGILADLGVSSHQFDVAERGFSTRFEADLDMRMDQQSDVTAQDILNSYSEASLHHIFNAYGEVRNANKLTEAIVKARKKSPIKTVSQLKEAIKACVFKEKEHQYLAQVFQALRIEVNKELDVLREFLEVSADVLAPGGRLAVISYHSLEDRLVKNYIAHGKFDGEAEKDVFGNVLSTKFRPVHRKAITASPEELVRNTRSRSARLRVAEKI
jgi:16S rRNA (cytosine1402-N4)-methyltransferase